MLCIIILLMLILVMLQSFLNKYCKQVFLDLSLMVKMSLSDQRDMHDSLQLSWHLMIFKLFVVDFYLENPRWRIRDRFSVRTPEQYYPQLYFGALYFSCKYIIYWTYFTPIILNTRAMYLEQPSNIGTMMLVSSGQGCKVVNMPTPTSTLCLFCVDYMET